MSKLVKKRPPLDHRRFSPVFPIPELQQTATAKDKSCTYIPNKNRRCSRRVCPWHEIVSLVTGIQSRRAVTISLLHWFSGASCEITYSLKLQLDLFIERIGCTYDFRWKYKCSSCPSLLRFVEARGLEKPAKIDDDRAGIFSSKALTRVMISSLSSFLFSPPPPPTH